MKNIKKSILNLIIVWVLVFGVALAADVQPFWSTANHTSFGTTGYRFMDGEIVDIPWTNGSSAETGFAQEFRLGFNTTVSTTDCPSGTLDLYVRNTALSVGNATSGNFTITNMPYDSHLNFTTQNYAGDGHITLTIATGWLVPRWGTDGKLTRFASGTATWDTVDCVNNPTTGTDYFQAHEASAGDIFCFHSYTAQLSAKLIINSNVGGKVNLTYVYNKFTLTTPTDLQNTLLIYPNIFFSYEPNMTFHHVFKNVGQGVKTKWIRALFSDTHMEIDAACTNVKLDDNSRLFSTKNIEYIVGNHTGYISDFSSEESAFDSLYKFSGTFNMTFEPNINLFGGNLTYGNTTMNAVKCANDTIVNCNFKSKPPLVPQRNGGRIIRRDIYAYEELIQNKHYYLLNSTNATIIDDFHAGNFNNTWQWQVFTDIYQNNVTYPLYISFLAQMGKAMYLGEHRLVQWIPTPPETIMYAPVNNSEFSGGWLTGADVPFVWAVSCEGGDSLNTCIGKLEGESYCETIVVNETISETFSGAMFNIATNLTHQTIAKENITFTNEFSNNITVGELANYDKRVTYGFTASADLINWKSIINFTIFKPSLQADCDDVRIFNSSCNINNAASVPFDKIQCTDGSTVFNLNQDLKEGLNEFCVYFDFDGAVANDTSLSFNTTYLTGYNVTDSYSISHSSNAPDGTSTTVIFGGINATSHVDYINNSVFDGNSFSVDGGLYDISPVVRFTGINRTGLVNFINSSIEDSYLFDIEGDDDTDVPIPTTGVKFTGINATVEDYLGESQESGGGWRSGESWFAQTFTAQTTSPTIVSMYVYHYKGDRQQNISICGTNSTVIGYPDCTDLICTFDEGKTIAKDTAGWMNITMTGCTLSVGTQYSLVLKGANSTVDDFYGVLAPTTNTTTGHAFLYGTGNDYPLVSNFGLYNLPKELQYRIYWNTTEKTENPYIYDLTSQRQASYTGTIADGVTVDADTSNLTIVTGTNNMKFACSGSELAGLQINGSTTSQSQNPIIFRGDTSAQFQGVIEDGTTVIANVTNITILRNTLNNLLFECINSGWAGVEINGTKSGGSINPVFWNFDTGSMANFTGEIFENENQTATFNNGTVNNGANNYTFFVEGSARGNYWLDYAPQNELNFTELVNPKIVGENGEASYTGSIPALASVNADFCNITLTSGNNPFTYSKTSGDNGVLLFSYFNATTSPSCFPGADYDMQFFTGKSKECSLVQYYSLNDEDLITNIVSAGLDGWYNAWVECSTNNDPRFHESAHVRVNVSQVPSPCVGVSCTLGQYLNFTLPSETWQCIPCPACPTGQDYLYSEDCTNKDVIDGCGCYSRCTTDADCEDWETCMDNLCVYTEGRLTGDFHAVFWLRTLNGTSGTEFPLTDMQLKLYRNHTELVATANVTNAKRFFPNTIYWQDNGNYTGEKNITFAEFFIPAENIEYTVNIISTNSTYFNSNKTFVPNSIMPINDYAVPFQLLAGKYGAIYVPPLGLWLYISRDINGVEGATTPPVYVFNELNCNGNSVFTMDDDGNYGCFIQGYCPFTHQITEINDEKLVNSILITCSSTSQSGCIDNTNALSEYGITDDVPAIYYKCSRYNCQSFETLKKCPVGCNNVREYCIEDLARVVSQAGTDTIVTWLLANLTFVTLELILTAVCLHYSSKARQFVPGLWILGTFILLIITEPLIMGGVAVFLLFAGICYGIYTWWKSQMVWSG